MYEVDDLCEAACYRCGTDTELHRHPSLYHNGIFFGAIICEPCLTPYEYQEIYGRPRNDNKIC